MIQRIYLITPRGFCAGVTRSIDIVERCLNIYGKPIYVRHQIVHNEYVISDLERKGAVFVEELSEVPEGSRVVLSAHGSPPTVKAEAERMRLQVIDAVCPLVVKVHNEAIRYHRKGYEIVLIGHRGHQEVIGTMGYAPMRLIEKVDDVERLHIKRDKVTYLTQTTLSVDDAKVIVDVLRVKYPSIEAPSKEDVCYATTNRQEAVKALADRIDLLLVIGSTTSSNSNRLVETSKHRGVIAHLIPDKDALREEWFAGVENLGITSGASVPDNLVFDLVDSLKSRFPDVAVETFTHLEEDVQFSLPEELKDES